MSSPSFDQRIDDYVRAAISDATQRRVRSETFWSSFAFERHTPQRIDLLRAEFAQRGITITTSADAFGNETPDDWVMLSPNASPSASSILTLPESVFGVSQQPTAARTTMPPSPPSVAPASSVTATCPLCGNAVDRSASFCGMCGHQRAQRHATVPMRSIDTSESDRAQAYRARQPRGLSLIDIKSMITLGLVGVLLIYPMLGTYMPSVILGVGALAVIAWSKPHLVSSVMRRRIVQYVPAALVSSPTRRAVAVAIVMVPLASLIGQGIYGLLGGFGDDRFSAVGNVNPVATATRLSVSGGSGHDVVCRAISTSTAREACRHAYDIWLQRPNRVGFCVHADSRTWSMVKATSSTFLGDRCESGGIITGLVGGGLPPEP